MVTDPLQTGADLTRDNVEVIGRLSIKMVSELENILAAKKKFLEAVARADQIAQQTVEAAAGSIPVFQPPKSCGRSSPGTTARMH